MFETFLGVNPWTAVFILLNTLTILIVARHFLFEPVMKMIEARQRQIDRLYADATTAKENAVSLEAEYRNKLSVADENAASIVREAIAQGQTQKEQIVRQANAEADAIMDKAAASIAQEKKKAVHDAKNEISFIAIAIAQKVLQRQLQSADHQRMVDDFINAFGEET